MEVVARGSDIRDGGADGGCRETGRRACVAAVPGVVVDTISPM